MRHIIKIGLFSVLLASASVIAAEHQNMSHEAMQAAGQQWSEGVVKKVDPKNSRITLKHSAIAGVMPAMTMSYQVVPSETLKSIQPGDKVRFVLEKNVIVHIEALK